MPYGQSIQSRRQVWVRQDLVVNVEFAKLIARYLGKDICAASPDETMADLTFDIQAACVIADRLGKARSLYISQQPDDRNKDRHASANERVAGQPGAGGTTIRAIDTPRPGRPVTRPRPPEGRPPR